MKKLLFLTILSSVIFLKCSKKEATLQELLVTTTSISFNSGETLQIDAISDFSINYKSDHEYHATVSSSGLVTAVKVGETIITITSNGISKEVSVEVLPTQNILSDLILEWGILRSEIKTKVGEPDDEYPDEITYYDIYGTAEDVIYEFDTDDKLIATWVYINISKTSTLKEFLLERYAFINSKNGIDFYADSFL